jgi:hypothetical protein
MIILMPTAARVQQRYDHRLRNLVQRTWDVTIATDLGVPRATARGWLGQAPKVVVNLPFQNPVSPLRQHNRKDERRQDDNVGRRRRLSRAPGTARADDQPPPHCGWPK